MATLRDVAKLSGVSPATVTHVLRNRQKVSPDTRQRVLAAVRALNYRPTAVPAGGDGSTNTIGVFVWLGSAFPLLDNAYATGVLDGILAAAHEPRWNITLLSVTAWEDASSQLRHLADGRCDGFVLVAPPTNGGIPDALRERGYPFVMINSGSGNSAVHSVDIDNRTAAIQLTNHLIENGHRRLAFLPGVESYENTTERLQGFLNACSTARLPDPGAWILRPGTYDFQSTKERVRLMVERMASLPAEKQPTAMICGNDRLALAAAESLTEAGIAIPEEMSLVGFDDTPLAQTMQPRLTTIQQPLHQLGKRAVEILFERISTQPDPTQPAPPTVKEFLPCHLVVRQSVARREIG